MTDWMTIEDAHGTTYVPWTDGWAVGFRVERKGQPPYYVYLNPSSETDDGVPNVFLYEGPNGNPALDSTVVFVDVPRTS